MSSRAARHCRSPSTQSASALRDYALHGSVLRGEQLIVTVIGPGSIVYQVDAFGRVAAVEDVVDRDDVDVDGRVVPLESLGQSVVVLAP